MKRIGIGEMERDGWQASRQQIRAVRTTNVEGERALNCPHIIDHDQHLAHPYCSANTMYPHLNGGKALHLGCWNAQQLAPAFQVDQNIRLWSRCRPENAIAETPLHHTIIDQF